MKKLPHLIFKLDSIRWLSFVIYGARVMRMDAVKTTSKGVCYNLRMNSTFTVSNMEYIFCRSFWNGTYRVQDYIQGKLGPFESQKREDWAIKKGVV